MSWKPHNYQVLGRNFVVDRLFVKDEMGAALFADPGLGKTLMTLMAIQRLRDLGVVEKTLLIAPLRVVYEVWPAEIEKWGFDFDHLIVHGSPSKRKRALASDADLYLMNIENTDWYKQQDVRPDVDLLVVDESTGYKTWSTVRSKALRKILRDVPKRLILTGTPSPNSLADLHSQMYIVDNGETLGRTAGYFRNIYCRPGGYQNRGWVFSPAMTNVIQEKIAPMTMRFDAKDHLDLPEILYHDVPIKLPDDLRAQYQTIERQLFAQLDDGQLLTASGAGGSYLMCRSFCNGGLYEKVGLNDRITHNFHEVKVDVAEEIVEELQGKPTMIIYQFKHDLERLQKRWPKAPYISGGLKSKVVAKTVQDWNAGKIPVLLCQPQAMSHGLNLQGAGNDIIWFGLTDQPEIYQQTNARIWRQGVRNEVRIHHLLMKGTIEMAILRRLKDKRQNQTALLDALKAYRHGELVEV